MLITNDLGLWLETGIGFMHMHLHDHANRMRMHNYKGFEIWTIEIIMPISYTTFWLAYILAGQTI